MRLFAVNKHILYFKAVPHSLPLYNNVMSLGETWSNEIIQNIGLFCETVW